MIFTLVPLFLNCAACGHKFSYHTFRCDRCGQAVSADDVRKVQVVVAQCQERMGQPHDQARVRYSKFYSSFGGYHHIYAIPFYSVEEVLVAENLKYCGPLETEFWIAGFRFSDQRRGEQQPAMNLLSWQPLLWDEQKEIYIAGPDEGGRTVPYTPFE